MAAIATHVRHAVGKALRETGQALDTGGGLSEPDGGEEQRWACG